MLFEQFEMCQIERKNIFQKCFETFKVIMICAIVFCFILGCFYGYFCWTKSSLEDLSGKEVSTSTVLWTMFVTEKVSR